MQAAGTSKSVELVQNSHHHTVMDLLLMVLMWYKLQICSVTFWLVRGTSAVVRRELANSGEGKI